MDFSGLTYDETYYELMLRGEQRRDLSLRQAKRLLHTIADKPTVSLVLNSEGELNVCKAKFSQLTELVNNFQGTESDPHLDPLDSRIGHLRRRTLRISDAKLSEQTKTLLSAIEAMEDALAIKVRDNARSPRSTSIPTVATTSCSMKSTPVSKWNLYFNGQTPVREFLERVEELRLSNRVSKSDLFNSASELFRDHALNWFRIEINSIPDWDCLIERLKNEYHPKDYDHQLKNEILRRKQGPLERPGDFITAMRRLYSHLDHPVPVDEQLYTIRSNLQPRYADHAAAVNIQSFDELKELCTRLSLCDSSSIARNSSKHKEAAYTQPSARSESRRFTRGPSPHRSLNPASRMIDQRVDELSRSPSPSGFAAGTRTSRPETSKRVSFSTQASCWNCHQPGHRFPDCQAQWTRFCYRCGTPDVITPTCPRCSRNRGNEKSEL